MAGEDFVSYKFDPWDYSRLYNKHIKDEDYERKLKTQRMETVTPTFV